MGLYTSVWSPLALTGIGAAVTFIGVSVVAPLFARRFGRVVGGPAAPGLRGGRAPGPGERGAQAAAHGGHRLGADDRGGPGHHRGHSRRLRRSRASKERCATRSSPQYQVQPASLRQPLRRRPEPGDRRPPVGELPEVAVASTYRIGAVPRARRGGCGDGLRSAVRVSSYLIGVDDGTDDVVRLEVSAGELRRPVGARHGDAPRGLRHRRGPGGRGQVYPIEFPDGALVDLEVVAVFGADLFSSRPRW